MNLFASGDRYATQRSLPVHLIKGKFYYMESIMKDDHQADHLEVAMQTPDGNFYKVIPSAFLWTVYQRPYGRLTTVLSVYFHLAKSRKGCGLHPRATPSVH